MELMSKEDILEYAEKRIAVCKELKEMIVEQLCLEIEPEFITDDQPLFGRGLELDSIDALELAVGMYDHYQLTLSDGDTKVFSSVNSMADYVLENAGAENDSDDETAATDDAFVDLDD